MIAFNNSKSSYLKGWIKYCEEKCIDYTYVNIYDSDLISKLKKNNIQFLFCQPGMDDYKTTLIAKSVIFSVEKAGIITYPNYDSIWHYDDKISQKYLFEALNIPHAPMHAFFERAELSEWLNSSEFPLVFKLRGGASSSNVFLLKNRREADRLLKIMFTKGMKPFRSVLNDFNTKISTHSEKRNLIDTFVRLPNTIKNIVQLNRKIPRQHGYFLVQDFYSNNNFDTRVVVVGNKAFAFRRFNRPDDFRASGSKNVDLSQENIDQRAIKLAFESANKLGTYSMAFDIIYNPENNPVIIEISYTCPVENINKIGGYWDSSMVFHNDPIRLEEAILENVLEKVK